MRKREEIEEEMRKVSAELATIVYYVNGSISERPRRYTKKDGSESEQKALPTLWRDASKDAVFLSAGAVVKLHMNTNFILSIELAKGFNPQLGDLTVSMATTYMF